MNCRHLSAALLLSITVNANATDIVREVQQTESDGGSFAELGISLFTAKLPLVGFNDLEAGESADSVSGISIDIDTRLQYKGFFIELLRQSQSELTLGYNAYTTPNTKVELILTSQFTEVERSNLEGFETITTREGDFNAGIRSSHYIDDNIVQLEMVRDISDSHDGVIAAIQLGKQMQVKNWNLHGLIGTRYFSDSVVDHYFGVSADEATTALPAYTGSAGFLPTIQLGATTPINEKWIFKATAEYADLPDTVVESPLSQGDSVYSVAAGIHYIFGGK